MAGLAPVELTADCATCGLEGGVVEVYDALVAACRFGLPARTRCKLCTVGRAGVVDRDPAREMREIAANRCPACLELLEPAAIDERCCARCGASARLEETEPARRFTVLSELEAALDAWAEREGFPSRESLVAATFAVTDVPTLLELVRRGEPLETLADPFANMGMRTTGGAKSKRKEPPLPNTPRPASPKSTDPETPQALAVVREREAASAPIPSAPRTVPLARPMPVRVVAPTATVAPPSAPPRAIVYPLVSVVAADGEIHPAERALVDRFLIGEGLAPLSDDEFAVHHPSAVAHLVPPTRREDVVKLMCETAAIDGLPDESELRVIRAYATAWGVDDEKIEFWMWGYESMNTSLTRQLFLKLRRFVLSARWGDAET